MKKVPKVPSTGSGGPLAEKEMPAHLASLSPGDWKPLFRQIPRIQAKKGFGKWHCPKKKNGVMIAPYFSFGKTEREFLEIVYRMQLVIAFDWGRWGRARHFLKRDMSRLGLLTLLKVMTSIVRSDRYCEGALHSAMADGSMLKILKAIKTRVANNAAASGG